MTDRLLGRADEDVAILVELGECTEPALVPYLLDHVFSGVRSVVRPTAVALDRALAAASPDELLELEQLCRAWWPYWALPKTGWRNLRPLDACRFNTLGDPEVAVVGVASFHSDGYVREAAVTRLDAISGGRELPFLLVRLNDWVTQVAERARVAVERRMTSAYAAAFLDSLPILLRLEISRRREHRAILDQAYALLRAPEQREVLARGLTAPDRRIRRATFRLAREASHTDRTAALRQALRDPDTLIRLEAVADAGQHLSAGELASILPAINGDPYPPIRREGLAAAAKHLADGADTWLVRGLLDSSKSVREVARFFLHRSGRMSDFAAYYRERLRAHDAPRQLASALAGLGETGGAPDMPLVLPYLEHDMPTVRQASLRALASLDLAAQLPRIVGMLRDAAPSVSHAARRVLRPRVGQVGAAALTSVFRTAPHAHSRFDALALGVSLGKWDSLPILLEATADRDERIRASARVWLNAWIAKQNRSFAQPTLRQIQDIHTALDVHRFAIDASVASELRSVLRYWTKSSAGDAR